MAESVFNDQKVKEYQELLKKHDKIKSDLIKSETVLEEKQKKLKELIVELKELGVPISDIATWRKNLEASLLQDLSQLSEMIEKTEALLKAQG